MAQPQPAEEQLPPPEPLVTQQLLDGTLSDSAPKGRRRPKLACEIWRALGDK